VSQITLGKFWPRSARNWRTDVFIVCDLSGRVLAILIAMHSLRILSNRNSEELLKSGHISALGGYRVLTLPVQPMARAFGANVSSCKFVSL
jgi:hypothetical protein